MVLCWLTSSGTSRVHCHVHVGISLFPLSPPEMSFPAQPALSCSAPSLIAVVTSHQPSRYSLQQVLSSPLQPLAPKQLCSIPMIKLVGNVRFHVLLNPLLTSCYFFPTDSNKSNTASLLFALHRNPITETISLTSPPNFFPVWHRAILLPLSLVFAPFTPPQKYSHALLSSILRLVSLPKETQRYSFFIMLVGHNASRLCFSFEEQPLQPLQPSPAVCDVQILTTLLSSASTQKTNSVSSSIPITLRSTLVHETHVPCNLLLIISS